MTDVNSNILNHWVNSYEEDADGVEVYRSADFHFPPSRFRRGFDLRADGELQYEDVGSTDKPLVLHGRWSSVGPQRIRLEFDDASRRPEVIEIISIDDGVLRVKRSQAQTLD